MLARRDPTTRFRHQWVVPVAFAVAAAVLIPLGAVQHSSALAGGIIVGIVALFLAQDYLYATQSGKQLLGRRDPTADRVQKLVDALSESTAVMTAIRREVESNQRLVERLQADARTHEQLLALHRSEVEAVAQVVASEVRREGRRGLYVGFVINAFFFGLGVLVTLLLT